ncbi:MAG: carboxypeptidase regulatory-like domain-containing protein [Vicinamibacterales bacterium]
MPRVAACVMAAGMVTWLTPMAAAGVAARLEAQGGERSGRVAGKVRLTVAGGAPSASSAYPTRGVSPRAKALPEMLNVVVFFADVPALVDLKAMRAEIAQKDEQFVPHVVAITTGSRVEFPNRDLFFHNVFSLSRPATFDLGKFASGATKSRSFLKPGIVKVYCHIHSQMSAVIRVFDHSWFTIPNEDGNFAIDGVPAGDYTLVAWHERIGERRDKVTIRAGATTDITFTLPVLEPRP